MARAPEPGRITATQIAQVNGADLNAFLHALRRRKFNWHGRFDRWNVVKGSPEHADMERVVRALLLKPRHDPAPTGRAVQTPAGPQQRDARASATAASPGTAASLPPRRPGR